EAGATAMGIDHRLRLDHALEILPEGTPVQGNIDPAVLFTSEQARFAEADAVLAAGAGASGHVVNLGHGVPPDADPQVLTDLVSYLHSQPRSEEHTSELQSRFDIECRLLLEKKKTRDTKRIQLQTK